MTLLNQFKVYLYNEFSNEFIEDREIEVEVTDVSKHDTHVEAKGVDGKDYKFYYNPYFETEEGTVLYDFTPIN